MLICDYKNGAWGQPEIIPFQPMSLMPSAKFFITVSPFLKE
jgi:branched-chain amino acid aminotransferase